MMDFKKMGEALASMEDAVASIHSIDNRLADIDSRLEQLANLAVQQNGLLAGLLIETASKNGTSINALDSAWLEGVYERGRYSL